jgi:hypothetical protein
MTVLQGMACTGGGQMHQRAACACVKLADKSREMKIDV